MCVQLGFCCIYPLYSLICCCWVKLYLLSCTFVCRRMHEICPLHVFLPSALFILAAFSKTCRYRDVCFI